MSCMGCCYRHEGDLEARPPKANAAKSPMNPNTRVADLKSLRKTWRNPTKRKIHPAKLYRLLTRDGLASNTPLTAPQQAAQNRLRQLFSEDSQLFRELDTVLEAAMTLDSLLFDDMLCDRIAISVRDFREKSWQWKNKLVKGRCIVPPGPVKRLLKVKIQLNRTLMVYGCSYEILGTLIHEMMHAYLVLAKGRRHGEEEVHALVEQAVRRVGVEGLRVEHVVG